MSGLLNWNKVVERLFWVYGVSTQEQLGMQLGVSQDMVSKWTRGKAKPTWNLIGKVVESSGFSWEWLLTGRSSDLFELSRAKTMEMEIEPEFFGVLHLLLFRAASTVRDQGWERRSDDIEVLNRALFIFSLLGDRREERRWLPIADHLRNMSGVDWLGGDECRRILVGLGYADSFSAWKEAVATILGSYKEPSAPGSIEALRSGAESLPSPARGTPQAASTGDIRDGGGIRAAPERTPTTRIEDSAAGTSGYSIPVIGLVSCNVTGWYNPRPLAVRAQLPMEYDSPKNLFAVIAVGCSMEPDGIKEGYLLFCDGTVSPEGGDAVYVKTRDGTATVKRFIKRDAEWIYLQGWLDPDERGIQKPFTNKYALEFVESVSCVVMIRRRA